MRHPTDRGVHLQVADIQDLPEKYREVIWYYHFQFLSQKRIAEVLGISVSCVESRLYRGRKKLKEMVPCLKIFAPF